MNPTNKLNMRYLDTDDAEQYNDLLRYTFQVTEDELAATGWEDDEIMQSKFPVLERADVLGCFDGDRLVSQFAAYPLKMNIYGKVFQVGFVTSVCTYPEYTGQGIMKKLMFAELSHMRKQGRSFALLYPYSIPLYHHLGWEIISNKISYVIKDNQIPNKLTDTPAKLHLKMNIGTLTTLLMGYKTAERLYELERIEGDEETIERLDDVLFHKIPYISDYL